VDRLNKKHVDIRDTDTQRPEIDRVKLREMLLDSLDDDTVQWNSAVKIVEKGTIHFDGRSESGWDLIVGADGAWSKVRPLLTDATPSYSGVSGVEMHFADANKRHPEISKMVGNGSYFAFGDEIGHVLLTQRDGEGRLRSYALGMRPENWIKDELDQTSPATVRSQLLKDYTEFAPDLQRLIKECDDTIIPRTLYMLPVGLAWKPKPGFALMGDAAHLMTPFAGQGVNIAMKDAQALAQEIIATPNDLDRAVSDYEKQMFEWAKLATMRTWNSLESRFRAGGTEAFAKMVNELLLKKVAAGTEK
jgi:2-polyprenyl-6-methoxyphenol hydroxylase-like FAD-dependent oxidoreductase